MDHLNRLGPIGGTALVATAAGWAVAAPWLSAQRFISVLAELISYWPCVLVAVGGAYITLASGSESAESGSLFWRRVYVACALVTVIVSWFFSDQQFIAWKMLALPPPAAWPQMASDLESVARQVARSGRTFLTNAPPRSLQQLGCGVDYRGVTAPWGTVLESNGVAAAILFGYKGRTWGLCVGPELFAKRYGRGGGLVRVGTNAFFFAERGD